MEPLFLTQMFQIKRKKKKKMSGYNDQTLVSILWLPPSILIQKFEIKITHIVDH